MYERNRILGGYLFYFILFEFYIFVKIVDKWLLLRVIFKLEWIMVVKSGSKIRIRFIFKWG